VNPYVHIHIYILGVVFCYAQGQFGQSFLLQHVSNWVGLMRQMHTTTRTTNVLGELPSNSTDWNPREAPQKIVVFDESVVVVQV